MLYYLLVVPFVLMCFLLIFIIFLQKGKGSMGLGSMGGSNQMLFGGSGGQDLFQKATWIMVGLFLFGSLSLSIYKTKTVKQQQHVSQSTR